MKNAIMITLVSLFCSAAYAGDSFTVWGKGIDIHENKAGMIYKYGKPSNVYQGNNLIWKKGNSTIEAKFDQWGITNLTIDQGSVTIDGKTMTIGKDTPKTIAKKVQRHCDYTDGGAGGGSTTQTTRVGAEGEIYISFITAFNGGASEKAIKNTPVSQITLGYDDPLADTNASCN